MSGHSKWSKVKHQKAVTDVVKAKSFTQASRAITIAVKEGGGSNPDHNYRLRLAIEQARSANMPKDNIERAIAKGLGQGADTLEQITYEGFGPHGVALLIDTATDNRNRTVSFIKSILDRAGGSLATPHAVSYMFTDTDTGKQPKPEFSMPVAEDQKSGITALIDQLEALDDVQHVYTNAV